MSVAGGRMVSLAAALLLGVSGCSTVAPAPRPRVSPGPKEPAPLVHSAHRPPTVTPGPPAPRTLRGTSAWRLTKPAMRHEIEGYADVSSAAPGQPVRLMVSTSAHRFRAYAYRIGGYRGHAGRLIWSSAWVRGHRQRSPVVVPPTRTVEARWSPSLSLRTHSWPAGFYLIKLVASSGYQSYICLTLRSTSTRGRVTLVAPVMDWEAYNMWGGYDLYHGPPGDGRSWAVSFDRPDDAPGGGQFLFNVLGTVALAERLGIPLAYEADTDIATRPGLLAGATGYVSLGHDEYWTVPERHYVTAARDRGTNLAFLSSNTSYWRVRLTADNSGPNRLVVGYKADATTNDPARLSRPALTTARWRDPPHPDAENSLTGTLYECFPVDQPYRVASPSWWGFRGTGVRAGTEFPHLVAWEADRVYPVRSTPHPLQVLSYLPYSCEGVITSTESTYYTTPSGAGVIDFGTQRWACAVNRHCVDLPVEDTTFVRRVTSNVLRRFSQGPVGREHPAHDNVADFDLPAVNDVPTS